MADNKTMPRVSATRNQSSKGMNGYGSKNNREVLHQLPDHFKDSHENVS